MRNDDTFREGEREEEEWRNTLERERRGGEGREENEVWRKAASRVCRCITAGVFNRRHLLLTRVSLV